MQLLSPCLKPGACGLEKNRSRNIISLRRTLFSPDVDLKPAIVILLSFICFIVDSPVRTSHDLDHAILGTSSTAVLPHIRSVIPYEADLFFFP